MSHFGFIELKRVYNCVYKETEHKYYLPHEFYDWFFDSCEPYFERPVRITIIVIINSILL